MVRQIFMYNHRIRDLSEDFLDDDDRISRRKTTKNKVEYLFTIEIAALGIFCFDCCLDYIIFY
ncbi:hypothetical protein SDC9_198720 [bioreactor metagenome]|uniref:Uncharacterized protein n=1 Tax=bioreactor metagenome TaxID=1076179 RepID=A0A645IKT7_9ZZZZ